jgi:hypothetical protein
MKSTNLLWIGLAAVAAFIFLKGKSSTSPTFVLGGNAVPTPVPTPGFSGLAPTVKADADATAALIAAGGGAFASITNALGGLFGRGTTPTPAKVSSPVGSDYTKSYFSNDSLYTDTNAYFNPAPVDFTIPGQPYVPPDITYKPFDTSFGY